MKKLTKKEALLERIKSNFSEDTVDFIDTFKDDTVDYIGENEENTIDIV